MSAAPGVRTPGAASPTAIATARLPWQVPFVALAVIWGSSFLFIKVGLRVLAPIDVALSRTGLGAAVLIAVLLWQRAQLPRDRALWGHVFMVSMLLTTLPFTLFAYGETEVSSVLAGIWNAATPLLTLVVVMFALREERPDRYRVAGLAVGFLGVVVVLGPWGDLGEGALLGHLACLGAAACYAMGTPYARRFLAGRSESVVALSAGQLLCSTAVLGAATVFLGGAPGTMTAEAAGSLLALGALGTGLAYLLFHGLIRRIGATTATTVTYLMPIVSTVLGVIVLSEGVAWHEPVGAAIVLGGVLLSQRRLSFRRRVTA